MNSSNSNYASSPHGKTKNSKTTSPSVTRSSSLRTNSSGNVQMSGQGSTRARSNRSLQIDPISSKMGTVRYHQGKSGLSRSLTGTSMCSPNTIKSPYGSSNSQLTRQNIEPRNQDRFSPLSRRGSLNFNQQQHQQLLQQQQQQQQLQQQQQ